MRVIITGAAGFVGGGLAKHLMAEPDALGDTISELVLADRAPSQLDVSGVARWQCGDLSSDVYLDALLGEPADFVFHLASIPGSAAERLPDRGRALNLDVPIRIAEILASRKASAATVPRLVFASTVAVYGALGPEPVNEEASPKPAISYGAHKLMAEVYLADLSRRNEVDARIVRLPGVVARPPTESGHGSAFMSLIFHKAAAAAEYSCPVSRDASAWWMSLSTCVRNLTHAAMLNAAEASPCRVWQLPVLRASVGDLISALTKHFGPEATKGIHYEPDATIESLFGTLPELRAPRAIQAGFVADRNVDELVHNVFGR